MSAARPHRRGRPARRPQPAPPAPEHLAGQRACLVALRGALRDLQRAVIVTGIGINQVASIGTLLGSLERDTEAAQEGLRP